MDNDLLRNFEYDLYLLRQELEEIQNSGTISSNLYNQIKVLKDKEKDIIEETKGKLEKKHSSDFKIEGNFRMFSGRHREDIKKILPLDEEEIILLGGHGFTALGRLNRKDISWEYIYDFLGHIYSVAKISQNKYLVAGERGECRVLEKKGSQWVYTEIISPINKSIYHIEFLEDNKFILLGDQNLCAIVELDDSTFRVINSFEFNVQTWQKALVTRENEIICFGENGSTLVIRKNIDKWEFSYFVQGFSRKIYCYAPVYNGYMVFGASGETRLLTKKNNWEYGSLIDGFSGLIYDVGSFDPKTLIVVGAKKQCRPLVYKNEEWIYEDLIEGFPTYISAIKKWDERSYLVGGWNGQLALLSLDIPRLWTDYIRRIKEKTDIFF